MSTVYATPTMGGGAGSEGSGGSKTTTAPLYAYNNPSLSGSEEVYAAPASLVLPSLASTNDPTSFASSEVYYSLAKVADTSLPLQLCLMNARWCSRPGSGVEQGARKWRWR